MRVTELKQDKIRLEELLLVKEKENNKLQFQIENYDSKTLKEQMVL